MYTTWIVCGSDGTTITVSSVTDDCIDDAGRLWLRHLNQVLLIAQPGWKWVYMMTPAQVEERERKKAAKDD